MIRLVSLFEYHKHSASERVKAYTDRIKNIKDKLSKIEDKSSDTFKLQQGKLKVVTQNLSNFKKQQSIKKAAETK